MFLQISERDLGDDRPYAIVITGHSLVDSFNPAVQGEGTEKLFKVFSKAAVVLGCRISPKQKKDVVELVKKHVYSILFFNNI